MAYTKIHAVKSTVNKTIAYICNEKKTKEKLLVSTYATSIENAHLDFEAALSKTKSSDPNKAFHLIQSFAPGEVDYETAHKIGIELADKLLEGKHSYVIATHIDKGHCHNHIVFCAADHINHKKYHDCKKSYYHIRNLSDELCQEHNLSIITPGTNKGMKYNEWQAKKNGTSWKQQLRDDIDELIKKVNSYVLFLEMLRAKGYEIKGESFEEGSAKYISFKPSGSGNYIRGREKSLGAEYTKERIKARIEENLNQKHKAKVPFPRKRNKQPIFDYSKKNFIDTSSEKFQTNQGLHNWGNKQNLKIAASIYSKKQSFEELEADLMNQKMIYSELKTSLKSMEKELKTMGEILKYAKQYQENEPYHYRYQKSKNQDQYYRTHDTQLVLFGGAENMLERYGIDPKKMDIVKMENDYKTLLSEKTKLQNQYKSEEKNIEQTEKQLHEFQKYMGLQKDATSMHRAKQQELE